MTETEEVYTLLLTTSTNNTNKANNPVYRTDGSGNLTNEIWTVDYDTLFRGRQKMFKHCRVRFNLIGGTATYSSWVSQTGYLCANFASNYNSRTTDLPTILGLVYAKQNPNTKETTNPQCYSISTLEEIGVDINIEQLYGIQQLNLKMMNDDSFTIIKNVTNDWEIMLQFTLYN